jgi:hypothetical protein
MKNSISGYQLVLLSLMINDSEAVGFCMAVVEYEAFPILAR